MAWQAEQNSLCGGCGHPRDETMAADGPRYEAEPLRCKACQAREITRRQFTSGSEKEAGGDAAGLIVAVHPVED